MSEFQQKTGSAGKGVEVANSRRILALRRLLNGAPWHRYTYDNETGSFRFIDARATPDVEDYQV